MHTIVYVMSYIGVFSWYIGTDEQIFENDIDINCMSLQLYTAPFSRLAERVHG